MNKIYIATLLIALLTVSTGCKKFVEVAPPKTEIIVSEAFKDSGTATSAVLGIYINMLSDFDFINSGITIYSGLSADELRDLTNNPEQTQFLQNKILPVNTFIQSMWSNTYKNLMLINTCIEGIEKSNTLPQSVKQQLLGECKFDRAFYNFYLVNLWGRVPLVTSSDYKLNAVIAQSDEGVVYDQIYRDLKDAQALLLPEYPTSGKVRPNKWTATALLARTYLYRKDYANAETEASKIIDAGIYGPLPEVGSIFLKDSQEAIWQLMPSDFIVLATQEGYNFIGDVIAYGSPPNFAITESLSDSFETGDMRKSAWIASTVVDGTTYQYPYKYKDHGTYSVPPTEYYIMFRLSEQYMIRAESRAQLGKLPAAVSDVNTIRARAGLGSVEDVIPSLNKADLLNAIAKENRHEFFAEWGHRWLDLKRTGQAANVLSANKTSFTPAGVLFPIPQSEITLNKNLIQNAGY
ncbi:RagB/SusD family nutrient uptake outer membrane protein [Mucilaginibacter psychrotolerans]|uniref:RagB/SusD family nutrient uptake outer membrane protein n=1 Tax=Mucilaginibacter psychrotolerans TaxID=1524096 RepID=A0A4Y8SGF4_9SPHI|nr:RagB/SusD family nutrient uptake outer membrane protein [Mucilaginibacter psychrotolerans]TFF37761.1 RagB/SusD family nutrient uptake outer membrane protein [Mucilaginibacter psychrotolerans]